MGLPVLALTLPDRRAPSVRDGRKDDGAFVEQSLKTACGEGEPDTPLLFPQRSLLGVPLDVACVDYAANDGACNDIRAGERQRRSGALKRGSGRKGVVEEQDTESGEIGCCAVAAVAGSSTSDELGLVWLQQSPVFGTERLAKQDRLLERVRVDARTLRRDNRDRVPIATSRARDAGAMVVKEAVQDRGNLPEMLLAHSLAGAALVVL